MTAYIVQSLETCCMEKLREKKNSSMIIFNDDSLEDYLERQKSHHPHPSFAIVPFILIFIF